MNQTNQFGAMGCKMKRFNTFLEGEGISIWRISPTLSEKKDRYLRLVSSLASYQRVSSHLDFGGADLRWHIRKTQLTLYRRCRRTVAKRGWEQSVPRKKLGAQLLGRLRVFFIKENYCAFSLGFREILRNTEQVFLKKHDPLWSRFSGHEMNNRLLPHSSGEKAVCFELINCLEFTSCFWGGKNVCVSSLSQ